MVQNSEPKTLKDLIVKDLFSEKDDIVRTKELKAEAIKWVKVLSEKSHQLYAKNIFMEFFNIKEEEE